MRDSQNDLKFSLGIRISRRVDISSDEIIKCEDIRSDKKVVTNIQYKLCCEYLTGNKSIVGTIDVPSSSSSGLHQNAHKETNTSKVIIKISASSETMEVSGSLNLKEVGAPMQTSEDSGSLETSMDSTHPEIVVVSMLPETVDVVNSHGIE